MEWNGMLGMAKAIKSIYQPPDGGAFAPPATSRGFGGIG